MARDVMQVDGVPSQIKDNLKALALERFGKANASLMVRHLIAECLAQQAKRPSLPSLTMTEQTGRIEIALPLSVIAEISKRAEEGFSSRNFYIGTVIAEHLGRPQMQAADIEVLRKSNVELARIGANVNQIANALNILAGHGGGDKLAGMGKKMASFRAEIKTHTNRVLRVLKEQTVLFERRGNNAIRTGK